MKSQAPALAPLLRSDAQGEMLALLLLHPDREYTLTEVAAKTSMSLPMVHAEITKLVNAGLLADRRVGRARLVRARSGHLLYRSLRELLELTYGPVAVLPDVLTGVPGLREAYVYGSWAARRQGEVGDPPGDVDVVVVGRTPHDLLVELGEEAGRRLHREVVITRIAPEVWDEGRDPFVRTLQSRPLVRVLLSDLGADDDSQREQR